MNTIGIMQGRLSPSKGKGIQFFPFESWQEEFSKAKNLGLSEIDFIFDLDRYTQNPLWSETGRKKIKELIKETGVRVRCINADFFMRRPLFFKANKETHEETEQIFVTLLRYAKEVGVETIELPLLDNSSLQTEEQKKDLIESLRKILKESQTTLSISLEVDLKAKECVALIKEIGDKRISVVYDSGNAAALGFSPEEEIPLIAPYLSHVHIKDRKLNAGTVPLGEGAVQFENLFKELKKINFKGNLIIQAARGTDGGEEETVKKYKQFIETLITNYLA